MTIATNPNRRDEDSTGCSHYLLATEPSIPGARTSNLAGEPLARVDQMGSGRQRGPANADLVDDWLLVDHEEGREAVRELRCHPLKRVPTMSRSSNCVGMSSVGTSTRS